MRFFGWLSHTFQSIRRDGENQEISLGSMRKPACEGSISAIRRIAACHQRQTRNRELKRADQERAQRFCLHDVSRPAINFFPARGGMSPNRFRGRPIGIVRPVSQNPARESQKHQEQRHESHGWFTITVGRASGSVRDSEISQSQGRGDSGQTED